MAFLRRGGALKQQEGVGEFYRPKLCFIENRVSDLRASKQKNLFFSLDAGAQPCIKSAPIPPLPLPFPMPAAASLSLSLSLYVSPPSGASPCFCCRESSPQPELSGVGGKKSLRSVKPGRRPRKGAHPAWERIQCCFCFAFSLPLSLSLSLPSVCVCVSVSPCLCV